MAERSILRIREKPHVDPAREAETIVEVLRDGNVVAHIYGTREGVQIVSHRIPKESRALYLDIEGLPPAVMLPLLDPSDACPWCGGTDPACALCEMRRDA
jgi:hypothetical protein